MKKYFVLLLILISAIPVFAQNPQEILKKADAALFPKNAEFKWTLTLKKAGESDKVNKFLCWKKGDLKYLFFNIWPDASFGQVMMRIDNTIWNYLPLADDTVKTSYKSAFLGSDLSYADVMYNELALYYEVSLLSADAKVITLELKAKAGADGYARIVTQIDAATFATLKREYFSKSGQKLKEIVFRGFKFQGSQIQAMTLEVTQPLLSKQSTIAEFFDIQPKTDIKDSYFSLNFAKTYRPQQSW